MQVKQKMLELITLSLNGKSLEEKINSEQTLEKLYNLSVSFDLAPMVSYALGIKEVGGGVLGKFLSKQFSAVKRYENFLFETENLRDCFNKANIPFILLKGAVMRDYYTEPWMRTACDIDVLVKEKDSIRAQKLLIKDYGYKYEKKGRHDVSLISKGGVNVELHTKTVEKGRANESNKVLEKIWEYAYPEKDGGFEYKLDDGMFYFYHVAHMAKHFECGGCGLRPFIDLYLLNSDSFNKDLKRRAKLLEEGGLTTFNEKAVKLCKVWFLGDSHDKITSRMEDYVFSGGVYGNFSKAVAVKQQKQGGRFRYLLRRIFLPYDMLKEYYPKLEKRKILLPFYQVKRWFRLLKKQNRINAKRELKISKKVNREDTTALNSLFKDVGL